MVPPNKNDKSRLICLCNAVSQSEIESAIEKGCTSLGRIFDTTAAGVGACGGTCQPILRKMLETYQTTGKFPDNPRPPSKTTRDKNLRRKNKV